MKGLLCLVLPHYEDVVHQWIDSRNVLYCVWQCSRCGHTYMRWAYVGDDQPDELHSRQE